MIVIICRTSLFNILRQTFTQFARLTLFFNELAYLSLNKKGTNSGNFSTSNKYSISRLALRKTCTSCEGVGMQTSKLATTTGCFNVIVGPDKMSDRWFESQSIIDDELAENRGQFCTHLNHKALLSIAWVWCIIYAFSASRHMAFSPWAFLTCSVKL